VRGNDQLEVTSFQRNDGSITVIAMNRYYLNSTFKLVSPSPSSIQTATRYAEIVLPPHSIVTLVL
jgi:hypothetical protein